MADKLQILLELESRGTLPPDKKQILDEARKRGLVPNAQADTPSLATMPPPRPDTPLTAQQPQQSISERAGLPRGAGLAIRDTLAGLSTLPYMGADAITGLANMAGANMPSSSEARDKTLDQWFPKPQTMPENVVSGANQFAMQVPTMAGTAVASGLKSLAPLAENLMPQLLGSVIGGGAYGAAKSKYPDSPVIQSLASLAGGVAGTGATTTLAAGRANAAMKAAIPTTKGLEAAAGRAYKAAEDAGAVIKPEAIDQLKAAVQAKLAEKAYHPGLQPRVKVVLDELDRVGGQNIGVQGMQILKQLAGDAYDAANPKSGKLGSTIGKQIDDFMAGLGADDVLQGDAQTAASQWKLGDKLWSQAKKSETIEAAIKKATNQTKSTGTGGNIQNKLKQAMASIVDTPSKARGFTADERAAMQAIIDGTATEKALRLIGRLSPSGNALNLMFQIGGATSFGPGFLGFGATGFGAKMAADSMTKSAVKELQQLIRAGGKMVPSEETLHQAVKARLAGTPSPRLDPYVSQLVQRLVSPQAAASGTSGTQSQDRRP